jgi:hypothetical protein
MLLYFGFSKGCGRTRFHNKKFGYYLRRAGRWIKSVLRTVIEVRKNENKSATSTIAFGQSCRTRSSGWLLGIHQHFGRIAPESGSIAAWG